MHMGRIATTAALLVVLAACGSTGETSGGAVMPDVVGQQLDVARSDISRAGIAAEVEVVGGGTFGVVVDSNWQVCEQVPAPGEVAAGSPRLTVDRSCGPGPTDAAVPPPAPLLSVPTPTDAVVQTTAPATIVTTPPTQAPVATTPPAPQPAEVYYANCTEMKAAGAAPKYAGEPGYRPALDRDKDGIACDK